MIWLGLVFAVFGGFASFGIGCATQVNAIARGLFLTVCRLFLRKMINRTEIKKTGEIYGRRTWDESNRKDS